MARINLDSNSFPVRSIFSSAVSVTRGGKYETRKIDGVNYIVEVEPGESFPSHEITTDRDFFISYANLVDFPEFWDWARYEDYIDVTKLIRLCSKYGLPLSQQVMDSIYANEKTSEMNDVLRSDDGIWHNSIQIPLLGLHLVRLHLLTRLIMAVRKENDMATTVEISLLLFASQRAGVVKGKLTGLRGLHEIAQKEKELLAMTIPEKCDYADKLVSITLDGYIQNMRLGYWGGALHLEADSIITACFMQLTGFLVSLEYNAPAINFCSCGNFILGNSGKKRCNDHSRSTENYRKKQSIIKQLQSGASIPDLAKRFKTSAPTITKWWDAYQIKRQVKNTSTALSDEGLR